MIKPLDNLKSFTRFTKLAKFFASRTSSADSNFPLTDTTVMDVGFVRASSSGVRESAGPSRPRSSARAVFLSLAKYNAGNTGKRDESIAPILKRPPGSGKLPLVLSGTRLYLYLTARCHPGNSNGPARLRSEPFNESYIWFLTKEREFGVKLPMELC
jgi:hypothetical protein